MSAPKKKASAPKKKAATPAAATWKATARKVSVKSKDGRMVEKTVYKHSSTGELRVKKLVERDGVKKTTYVKFS